MENTYTYTARSAEDPSRMVTFTLRDHRLTVDLTTSAEDLRKALRSSQEDVAADETLTWIKTIAGPLHSRGDDSFSLDDIDASVDRDALRIAAWTQSDDEHVQPIIISLDRVDNADAARAFVRELNRRKLSLARRQRLLGVIGQRLYWFLTGFFTATLSLFWLRHKRS